MSKKLFLLFTFLGSITLLTVSFYFEPKAKSQVMNVPTITPFKVRNLLNSTNEEIQKASLDYLKSRFSIIDGAPITLFSKRVTRADLAKFDLEPPPSSGEDPPYMLVVTSGNLNVQLLGADKPQKAELLVQVLDLKAGLPTVTASAPSQSFFSKVLSEGSLLPDVSKTAVNSTTQQTNTLPVALPAELPKVLPPPVPQ
jgi:hypothetical protein